jgi:hypothetical protein
MMWKNVVLPEGFFDGVDVVALATTVNQPCQHCGQRHDGVGLIAHGGGLFCQRCGFRTEARAAKTKHQRRAPAKRPIVRVMATSMPRPRPREGGARVGAVGGRDGTGQRDDGGGDGGSDGGGDGPPPPFAPASDGGRLA